VNNFFESGLKSPTQPLWIIYTEKGMWRVDSISRD